MKNPKPTVTEVQKIQWEIESIKERDITAKNSNLRKEDLNTILIESQKELSTLYKKLEILTKR